MDIPFSKYGGGLKQLETDFKFPVMHDLFETAFSEFKGLDEMHARLKRDGINQIVTAGGVTHNFGSRPRRFSGDTNLPPGRYLDAQRTVRVLLKLADVEHLRGNVEGERALRESIFGRLDYE